MTVSAKLVVLCAIGALVLTCIANDPIGSPDDPEREIGIALHLSPALPPTRVEPKVLLLVVGFAAVDDHPVHGRFAELDIFRPPPARA